MCLFLKGSKEPSVSTHLSKKPTNNVYKVIL